MDDEARDIVKRLCKVKNASELQKLAIPRDEEAQFFMMKELKSGFLTGITGTYQDPEGYMVEDADVENFDVNSTERKKEAAGAVSIIKRRAPYAKIS